MMLTLIWQSCSARDISIKKLSDFEQAVRLPQEDNLILGTYEAVYPAP